VEKKGIGEASADITASLIPGRTVRLGKSAGPEDYFPVPGNVLTSGGGIGALPGIGPV
jgi:hypothetical protein